MGCAPSRPSRPIPQSRRQNYKPQNQNGARLSRPFNPDIPLHNDSRLSRPFNPNLPLRLPPKARTIDSERYADAYAQLTARSKNKSAPTPRKDQKVARPVHPARHGDAYAQLTARSKQKSAQGQGKGKKVQYHQGRQVKSQAAQRFKGDTLYFAS